LDWKKDPMENTQKNSGDLNINIDAQMQKVIELSKQENEEKRKRDKKEQEELDQAIALSLSDETIPPKPPSRTLLYQLRGFVQHKGTYATAGHYVTTLKNEDKWKKFDDQFVEKIDGTKALGDQSQREGYIFFFVYQEQMDLEKQKEKEKDNQNKKPHVDLTQKT